MGGKVMSASVVSLIIQLLSGAAGGNIAGALLKKFSLGPLGNSIVGILGGGIGGQLLSMIGMAGKGGVVSDIAGGGVGGAVLMIIVGVIKQAMSKSPA